MTTPAEDGLRDATDELIACVCSDVRPTKIARAQAAWDEALQAFKEESVAEYAEILTRVLASEPT